MDSPYKRRSRSKPACGGPSPPLSAQLLFYCTSVSSRGSERHALAVAHSFDICIDESGDQGFAFGRDRCSEWFVISAVVGLHAEVPEITAMVMDAKQAI